MLGGLGAVVQGFGWDQDMGALGFVILQVSRDETSFLNVVKWRFLS